MGTFTEWIGVLMFAAGWAFVFPVFIHAFSFFPGNQLKSLRRQTVLLRVHPLAFIYWGLVGGGFGLAVIFGSRVLHGRLLIILALFTSGAIAMILLSIRLAFPKSN